MTKRPIKAINGEYDYNNNNNDESPERNAKRSKIVKIGVGGGGGGEFKTLLRDEEESLFLEEEDVRGYNNPLNPELWLLLICGKGGGFGETFDRMINVSKEMRFFFLDRMRLKRVIDICKNSSFFSSSSEVGSQQRYILPKWFFCPIPLKELRPLGVLYAAIWDPKGGVVERVEEVDCTGFWNDNPPISFDCLEGVAKWGVENATSLGGYVNEYSSISRENQLKIREGEISLNECREGSFLELMEEIFLDEVLLDEGIVNPFMMNHLREMDARALKTTKKLINAGEARAFLKDEKNKLRSFFRDEIAPKILELKDKTVKKGREGSVDDANLLLTGGYVGFYMLQKRPKGIIESLSMQQQEKEEEKEKGIYDSNHQHHSTCRCSFSPKEKEQQEEEEEEEEENRFYICKNSKEHVPLVRDWKGKDVDLWIQTPLFDKEKHSRSISMRVNSWEGKGGSALWDGPLDNSHYYQPEHLTEARIEEIREYTVRMARYDEVDRRMFPEWTEKIPPSLVLECIYTEEGEDLISTISSFDIANVAWGWLSPRREGKESLLYCTPLALCAWEWDEVYVTPTGKNISYDGRSKLQYNTKMLGEFTGDYIEWSLKRHREFCIPFIVEKVGGPIEEGRSVSVSVAAGKTCRSDYHSDYHKCKGCNTPLLEEILESVGDLKARLLSYDDIPLHDLVSSTENAYRKERKEVIEAMEEALRKWKEDRICKYDERFKKQREEGRWHYLHCPLAYNW